MFRLRAYSAPLNMTAHYVIIGGMRLAALPPTSSFFLVMPPVMSTKGACARMETSPDKPDNNFNHLISNLANLFQLLIRIFY
jgi:hypothetical protein